MIQEKNIQEVEWESFFIGIQVQAALNLLVFFTEMFPWEASCNSNALNIFVRHTKIEFRIL